MTLQTWEYVTGDFADGIILRTLKWQDGPGLLGEYNVLTRILIGGKRKASEAEAEKANVTMKAGIRERERET